MIPLFKPHMSELGEEVLEILYSGKLNSGELVCDFEREFAKYVGNRRVAAVNSFNSAIYVALMALDLRPGDEVIASPMGCLASVLPIQAAGISIAWSDIDPGTGTLDPSSVKKSLNSNTKAVIHNHFCGYPGYIDEINEVAYDSGLKVIDDAIEAFGSRYKGRQMGSTGADASVFSLGPVRVPTAVEGGIVTFKEEEAFNNALLIRDCGIDRSKFRDDLGEIDLSCDVRLPGISAKMPEPNAFVGLKQMPVLNDLAKRQNENAIAWNEICQQGGIKTLGMMETEPSWWVFGVLVENKESFIAECRSKGFYASGVHADLSKYSIFGGRNQCLPGVDWFSAHFVALPCGWWVSTEEILSCGISCK